MRCVIVGAPVEAGAGRRGCEMGPTALRIAGIVETLGELGHDVVDWGDIAPGALPVLQHPNPAVERLPELAAWTAAIAERAHAAAGEGMPIFLGGDHSLAAGTLSGLARHAAGRGRPLFVLWLDAHPDFHSLDSTSSGHLHGVPLAYACGRPGFAGYFPALSDAIPPERVCTLGLRSVDPAERRALREAGVIVHDMRAIDEHGIVAPLRSFLAQVAAARGLLHVSLDVDFLDPAIAPGVGTAVPGGATFREAHLAMELINDSGLASSLDLVELNPMLDERGRTATLLVELAASLMGRRITDAPTGRT